MTLVSDKQINKALILAGTGDARNLIEYLVPVLVAHNAEFLISVVGENAAIEYNEKKFPVRSGAMDILEMKKLVEDQSISMIIDATHPFAAEVSRNAMLSADQAKIHYIRYERPKTQIKNNSENDKTDLIIPGENDLVFCVENHEEAVRLAISLQKKLNKNLTIMLTTGVKSLEFYCQKLLASIGFHTVVRLLPSVENLLLCQKYNISQADIIAMQGPFSKELNKELFLKYKIDVLISKESGSAGSTEEKILAAGELGIKSIVVNRPDLKYQNLCRSFNEVKESLIKILSKE
ncbi:MAG: precorrin-6A reductase [Spirochaetia bacterium]|nr:precorrin-6A reductase [Spirochaetia bacterium]